MAQRNLQNDETEVMGSESIEMGAKSGLETSPRQEERSDKAEPSEAKDSTTTVKLAEANDDSAVEYPPTSYIVVVLICLLSAVFLMALDRTIIATAIPRITDEFNGLDDIGWYGSAFMLTTTCFQLLWGKIYSFYCPKYIFLAVIGLFEVGSAICGSAPNSLALVIGRAVAGMGSAGIITGTFVITAKIVPLAKRPFYGAFSEAVLGLASALGPLLGGAFTSNVSWRWCFYVNLPIGGAVMLAILVLLKASPPAKPGLTLQEKLVMLDLLGEAFLFPGLVSLLLALQWGGVRYAWNSWRLILLLVIFAVLAMAFTLSQIFNQKSATIKAHVIKNRSIPPALWLMFCLAAVMQTFLYYIPLWLQAIKGKSPVQSGIATLPFVAGFVLAGVLGARIIDRVGYYTQIAITSSILMPIGAGLISTFRVDTPVGQWIGYQIILGFGVGLGLQMPPLTAFTVLEPQDIPVGMALIFFCQQLSGAIFVSVGENAFVSRFVQELGGTIGRARAEQILESGVTDIQEAVSVKDLSQKYNHALRSVWMVGIVMACLSALGSFTLEWRSVKKYQGPTRKQEKGQTDEKRQ